MINLFVCATNRATQQPRWRAQLVDRHSKRTVAKAHRSHHALFEASQKISIDVESEAVPMLDAVVLSFAICEEKRRRSETEAVTAADSA